MLKGFSVIELVKPTIALTVIIDKKKVRFVKACVGMLDFSPYVHFLLDPAGKRFAVQVSDKEDPQAVRFYKQKEKQGETAVIYQNATLIDALFTMLPNTEEDPRYAVDGVFVKGEKAIVFDFANAKPYQRRAQSK